MQLGSIAGHQLVIFEDELLLTLDVEVPADVVGVEAVAWRRLHMLYSIIFW